MRPENPFVVRREIAYGEPFCDRESEIRTFMESAVSDEPVCLLSPRRYGKSSLVNQVLGRLAEDGWVTLRLDMMTIRSLPSLVQAIERVLLEASGTWAKIKDRAASVAARAKPQMEIDPHTGTPTFSVNLVDPRAGEDDALMATLERVATFPERLGKPVCLAIDEFQEVIGLDHRKRIDGMIRSAFQRRSRRFLPIYLGSRRHMLKLMFESESAPFYRSARMLELKELGISEFTDFMHHQFKKTIDLALPPGIARATAMVFGGHPHALNVTASRLWTFCQLAGNPGENDVKDAWKEIVGTLIDEERAYYQQINRNISRSALNVLANIALQGVVSEPYSTSFAKLCGMTPGQVQTAMRVLAKEDKVIEGKEGYGVSDPLEALCLKTEALALEIRNEALDRLLDQAKVV